MDKDKNDPIIEDPYRRHRRVTPQKPARRLTGLARSVPPESLATDSTLPQQHPPVQPAEDDNDILRPFKPSARPVVDLTSSAPMGSGQGRTVRASFSETPPRFADTPLTPRNAPAATQEAPEPRRARWSETTVAAQEPHLQPAAPVTEPAQRLATPSTTTPLPATPLPASQLPTSQLPQSDPLPSPPPVPPKPLASAPRTPLPEVTDPRATHRFTDPPRRVRARTSDERLAEQRMQEWMPDRRSPIDRRGADTPAAQTAPLQTSTTPLAPQSLAAAAQPHVPTPENTVGILPGNLRPLDDRLAISNDSGSNLKPMLDRPTTFRPASAPTTPARDLPEVAGFEPSLERSAEPVPQEESPRIPSLAARSEVDDALETPFVASTSPVSDAPRREPLVRRRTQPTTRPRPASTEEHKSGTTTRSAITIAVLSLLLLAYAFNIGNLQTAADALLAHMNTSAQAGGNALIPFLSSIIPWLLLIPVLVLFYAIMITLARVIGLARTKETKSVRERQRRPLDEFKQAADREGVRNRYAYQAYLLLQPFVPPGETLQVTDTLEDDLGMKPNQVRELHLNLLRATERQFDTNGKLPQCTTVLDMLLAAQQAPRRARAPLPPVYEPGDPRQANRRK